MCIRLWHCFVCVRSAFDAITLKFMKKAMFSVLE
jgi:hypothetical protein